MAFFTHDDREAVLKTLGEEQRLKREGRPYREAVIVACEMILWQNPAPPPPLQRVHDFWWNKEEREWS